MPKIDLGGWPEETNTRVHSPECRPHHCKQLLDHRRTMLMHSKHYLHCIRNQLPRAPNRAPMRNKGRGHAKCDLQKVCVLATRKCQQQGEHGIPRHTHDRAPAASKEYQPRTHEVVQRNTRFNRKQFAALPSSMQSAIWRELGGVRKV